MSTLSNPTMTRTSSNGLVLITLYTGLVIVGAFISYLIGLRVEAAFPAASLPFFLGELLAVILIAAPIAMRFTPDDPTTSTPIQSPPEAGQPVGVA